MKGKSLEWRINPSSLSTERRRRKGREEEGFRSGVSDDRLKVYGSHKKKNDRNELGDFCG